MVIDEQQPIISVKIYEVKSEQTPFLVSLVRYPYLNEKVFATLDEAKQWAKESL